MAIKKAFDSLKGFKGRKSYKKRFRKSRKMNLSPGTGEMIRVSHYLKQNVKAFGKMFR